ncbi:hypothetical protein H6802_03505 [Candidatus Nomurabacteria bacterium]|uniref:HAMP domain-containing protein n=1 Tax=candidate division WWE3 bacterium TaxID=2053526 RepID=A0A955IW39_UNCKA|nr:hypothetical protein [candidate division WWE3 bacterium]MCB9823995.1 hypothetical protein [Candidatus Nomurabacteria bacterium]MCB9827034.1 hypothetical protein [Candidatus Nomurabacteria bacterium]MCB9827936.1 hypothetical protein [Candidatus Nomurabacteria bacterium]
MFRYLNIKQKVAAAALAVMFPVMLVSFLIQNQWKVINTATQAESENIINQLERAGKLDFVIEEIKYHDEVLTQSARNYIFTQNTTWKDNYQEHAASLERIFEEAQNLQDASVNDFINKISASNAKLVELELKAIAYADEGNYYMAQQTIDSEEYFFYKNEYSEALNTLQASKSKDYKTITESTKNSLKEKIETSNKLISDFLITNIFMATMIMMSTFYIAVVFSDSISAPIKKITNAAKDMAEGKECNIELEASNDELYSIAKSMTALSKTLDEKRDILENTIQERTQMLEKINSKLISRELKMMELKKQLKEIEERKA